MMSSKTLWYLRILGTFFRKSVDIAPFLSQNDGESAISSDSIRSFAFFCKMIDRYLMQWRCRCRTDYGLWIFSGVHFLFFYIFLKESFLFENGSFFVLCYIYNPKKFFLCISTIFEIFWKSTDNLLVGFGIYSEGAFLTNAFLSGNLLFPETAHIVVCSICIFVVTQQFACWAESILFSGLVP